MNYIRLLIGAVLASVVLFVGEIAFVLVLGSRIMAARDSAGLPPFVPRPLLGLLELFLTGFFLVWLYTAIRPRFGPGLLTALRAGFAGWFALVFMGTLHSIWEGFGFPAGLLLAVAMVLLPFFVVATVAGAWIYKEHDIR